jgi:hypothetical protein
MHCSFCRPFQLWFSLRTGPGSSAAAGGISRGQRRALTAARRAGRGAGMRTPRSFPAPHLRNLVLVACHSVYTGLDFHETEEKSSWFLLDYQKVRVWRQGRAWVLGGGRHRWCGAPC